MVSTTTYSPPEREQVAPGWPWRIAWAALVLAPYGVLVWFFWRPFGTYALAVFLVPTLPWAYLLRHVLLSHKHDVTGTVVLKVLGLLVSSYLFTSAVFLVNQGPELAAFWPIEAALLAGGDPSSPPRFDRESRRAFRSVVMERLSEDELAWADGVLSEIIEAHPDYYNVFSCRAAIRWRMGQKEAAIQDEHRAGESLAAGGFYLGYDSDTAEYHPPASLQAPTHEMLMHMVDTGRL